MDKISVSWEFVLKFCYKYALWEVFGKWRHFQISLPLWGLQVIRDLLCVRAIGEKFLSQRRCSVKKGAIKDFANFTGKHLCWSLFLIQSQAWGPATFLKTGSNTGIFPVKFAKLLRKKYLWTSQCMKKIQLTRRN